MENMTPAARILYSARRKNSSCDEMDHDSKVKFLETSLMINNNNNSKSFEQSMDEMDTSFLFFQQQKEDDDCPHLLLFQRE